MNGRRSFRHISGIVSEHRIFHPAGLASVRGYILWLPAVNGQRVVFDINPVFYRQPDILSGILGYGEMLNTLVA